MRCLALALLGAAGLLALVVSGALAAPFTTSPLALAVLGGGDEPELLLAQRAIDREWGASEDSVYVVVEIPGWRSEGWSAAMSAAVPGAGQIYAGERRGFWFAIAEALGWGSRTVWRERGRDLQDEAAGYAGDPRAGASRWSIERWSAATQQDPAEMQALYDRDRQAFFDRIAHDERFLAGWEGEPAATRAVFSDLRDHADDRLRYARYAGIALWLNHAVAAWDALRAARNNNVPLRRNLDLRVRGGWNRRGPRLVASLEGRF